MSKPARPELLLGPPVPYVSAARGAMGGIDFDPWSSRHFNRHVCARRYNDRDVLDADEVIHGPWNIPIEGRVSLCLATGAQNTRQMLGRLLREYRGGAVKQACAIFSHHEACRTVPWLWDFPICIPFRRLSYRYWDDELEQLRAVPTGHWSVVAFLPPVELAEDFHEGVARFHAAFSPLGRIMFSEYSGDRRWRDDYRRNLGREYSEMR